MADDSASFTFVTPEARRERPLGFESGVESDDWHFRNGPSPIAPRFVDQEQEETKHEEWAHTHFRRRNRLETRLEELQKDVASLTLKLRANPNRSTSLDASSFLLTQADKSLDGNLSVQSKKTVEKTRKVPASGRLTGSQGSTVRTLRELHNVTTERDQLKFELEKTKRALAAAEKKCQDALRSKKAYDKLKAHCDSLQESLDLSERIRVRQKKLLQQLQIQQQGVSRRTEKDDTGVRVSQRSTEILRQTAAKKRPASAGKSTGTTQRWTASGSSKQTQMDNSARGYGHTSYDILDSVVASSHHQEEDEEEEDAGLATHEQAPSEPTAAAVSRSRTPRSVLKSTTPTAHRSRSDFDSLLQVNHAEPPQFSTRRPSRIATNTARRPSRAQAQQREAMRQASMWAQRRGAPVDVSESTTRGMRRSPTTRPKNSFLAPTQASMRRLHELPLRGHYERPPFVV